VPVLKLDNEAQVISQDYVRTALAKGVPWRVVVWRRALRNSLISVITVVGLYPGILIGNVDLTEIVFNQRGLGQLIVEVLAQRHLSHDTGYYRRLHPHRDHRESRDIQRAGTARDVRASAITDRAGVDGHARVRGGCVGGIQPSGLPTLRTACFTMRENSLTPQVTGRFAGVARTNERSTCGSTIRDAAISSRSISSPKAAALNTVA